MVKIKERDIEQIIKDNVRKITGSPNNPIMPDQFVRVMTLSIYESIQKYHETQYPDKR